MPDRDPEASHFGFREVAAAEKSRLVRGVFTSVATRYDAMNDLMSVGVHRLWKSAFVARANPHPGELFIDVAGGTGDIAAALLGRADCRPRAEQRPPARAILCDINFDMLKAGVERPGAPALGPRLARVAGDAERLPLADASADACTIAFGIRNVTDIAAALREAFRVLRPGGRFLCLEFSHPVTEGLQKLYDAWSFRVIPWLGERVAGDRESYQYLVESIRRFPAQAEFAAMVAKAGFSRVKYENLSAGVVAIHSGWRL